MKKLIKYTKTKHLPSITSNPYPTFTLPREYGVNFIIATTVNINDTLFTIPQEGNIPERTRSMILPDQKLPTTDIPVLITKE